MGKDMINEIREEIANLEHKQWAHWYKYMRDNMTPENLARWDRQADTPYEKLSEEEKNSDRMWAGLIFALLIANYTLGDLVEKGPGMVRALREAIELFEGIRAGDYTPDSFTSQPAHIALTLPSGELMEAE